MLTETNLHWLPTEIAAGYDVTAYRKHLEFRKHLESPGGDTSVPSEQWSQAERMPVVPLPWGSVA